MSNVLPFQHPQERYVDRTELAELMGVCERTITRMVAEGMPSVTWGLRARRFRPSECLRWAERRGQAA